MAGTCAVIPASGLGTRLGNGIDKAFVHMAGRPIVAHTLSVFEESPDIDEIVLVTRAEYLDRAQSIIRDFNFSKVCAVTAGGATRQDSVRNGLSMLSPHCDIVAIHDAARPLVSHETISETVAAAREHGAAIAAVPVIDTIKISEEGRIVESTLDRTKLYAIQTPQTFSRELIQSAYENAANDGFVGTDDASLVEHLGHEVHIVHGSYENIKITNPRDIAIGESIMNQRISESSNIRVGHGYDIHRFAPGRTLVLGGVEFPGDEGLLGHSDADAILHAISDAILGATSSGDIGRLFPDTDPAFKDASSIELLRHVGRVVGESGWRVGNIDVSLIAQKPRIAKHTGEMQANIARALEIQPEQVSVKGRTAEGLGPIGEGLGVECHAVVLMLRPGC